MREELLHYIWKYSLYSNSPLMLADGTTVEVLYCGEHNHNAGPDFFNAKIKIGDTIWVGNIEIHISASDWIKHKHQNNKAYNSIILHVVANNDAEIKRDNGEIIPTIKINTPTRVSEQYQYLMNSKSWVSCESFINRVDGFTIMQWKDALMIERLQDKSKIIEERFILNNKNWEETFYQSLASNFGFKINSLPFEMLAKSIPISHLGKHKNQLSLIEAMLFGQSGLLPNNPIDTYSVQLTKDYKHLQNKFKLQPMEKHLWKYSRLRPSNFPTIRIAQFAALIFKSNSLLSKITEAEDFTQVRDLFDVQVSDYWKTHYVFEKESAKNKKRFGDSAFQNTIINTVAPLFVLMANINNQPKYAEKALDWLMKLKAEENNITRHWSELGLEVKNALDTQSLIQLKNLYCDKRRCLNCRIGNQVIVHQV